MFIDLNTLDDGAAITAGICVVGAGPAGIALALELSRAGTEVVVVESGDFEPEPATQALYEGAIEGLPYIPLDEARLRYFGGSANQGPGQSGRLQPHDFAVRDWVPDSGWPIGPADLAPHLARAAAICRIDVEPHDPAPWSFGPQMPAFPLGDAGFRPLVLRYPARPFRFGAEFRPRLESAEHVTVYLNANVLRLESDSDGRHAEALELATLAGKRATVRAETFVLAAGGLETCRLLLLSGPAGSARGAGPGGGGLGNGRDLVGRYVMEHPRLDTGTVRMADHRFLTRRQEPLEEQSLRLDWQLSPERQSEARILNHALLLVGNEERPGRFARIWDRLADRVTGPDERDWRLRIRLEHAPRAESRLRLIDTTDALGQPRIGLDLRLGELETATIAAATEAFATALGAEDLGRMQLDFDGSDAWQQETGWQYHHMGGARMSDDPARGVTDRDGRVHGIDNLYVAGSALFPTSGQADPTLNLVALAVRLADYLASQRTP